jgi:hypothetical protein
VEGLSQFERLKIERYTRLCEGFIDTDNLRDFISLHPEVLSDEAHKAFAAIIGGAVQRHSGVAGNSDRVREVVEKLQILRQAIQLGPEVALSTYSSPRRKPYLQEPAPPTYSLEVLAVEDGMALGGSVVASLMGLGSVTRCKLVGRITGSRLSKPVDAYSVEFPVFAGSGPLECLSGLARENAQGALSLLDRTAIEDGWRAEPVGPQWYSNRYRGDDATLRRALQ